MFIIRDTDLLTSDWHVLHRNIYWFLPIERKLLSNCEFPQKLSHKDWIAAEQFTYQALFEQLQEIIEKKPIRDFYFLGDLLFGITSMKEFNLKTSLLKENIKAFFDIFALLKSKGIKTHLILGNHDDYKLKKVAIKGFYEKLFDNIDFYHVKGNVIYTHYPLGYSLANKKYKGTPSEKYYRLPKIFARLDQKLLSEINDEIIINYHGHTHDKAFGGFLEKVNYRNVCIDFLIKNDKE